MGQASQSQAEEKEAINSLTMTTLYKLIIFLLSAVFLPPLEEAAANDDVRIDDIFSKQDKSKIVDVIEHPADQVAETVIQRALEGHVKKPNSTIVSDPQKPHKENYSVSFTFKESPNSRKRPNTMEETPIMIFQVSPAESAS